MCFGEKTESKRNVFGCKQQRAKPPVWLFKCIISLHYKVLHMVFMLQMILAFSRFFLDFTAAGVDFIFTISQKAFKP